MLCTLVNYIKGNYVIKAEGRFPERILNIAATSGIYVHDVKRTDGRTLVFSVSKKGCEKLLKCNVEELSITLVESFGMPVFILHHKKRVLLFLLPLFFAVSACIFSLFIWRIDIEGGDKTLRSQVREIVAENGIYVGALKHKADQYEIKRKAILELDDLSWLWVDIRGTSAKVKIHKRTEKPMLNDISEPSDVIAMHNGVIEKMQVYCGIPLVKEGMTVEKGQTIITGILQSENENIPTYYHHATGNVILRITEKKTVVIPKKTIKKTPTGEQKSIFTINFKKNNIKFSLNSGISYAEYDKIEKTYKIPLLPISILKTDYLEAHVSSEDTNVAKEIENRRKTFLKELADKKMDLCDLTEEITESEHNFAVTFIADCRVRTDKEIPIENEIPMLEGDTDGKNS